MSDFKPFTNIKKVGDNSNDSTLSPEAMRKIIFWLSNDYKKKVKEYNDTRKQIENLKREISLFSKHKNMIFYWILCQDMKEAKAHLKALHKRLENDKFQFKYHCDIYSQMKNRKD